MKLLILSDIHGNQAALQAVLTKAAQTADIEACILLGDIIDYGMHSNEVIQMIRNLPYPVLCNIRGNHEDAVIQDIYDRFSSERGRDCARYTRSILNQDSWDYICHEMEPLGMKEFSCGGKKCLAVHGSLEDMYWKSIKPENICLDGGESEYSAWKQTGTSVVKPDSVAPDSTALASMQPELKYRDYDYIFSGHSHLPHFIERYTACEDTRRRNKRKVIFINPGSVGQPRNLNNMAQFAVLDTETEQVTFEKVRYNIQEEQSAYHGQVDEFYRERLEWGI